LIVPNEQQTARFIEPTLLLRTDDLPEGDGWRSQEFIIGGYSPGGSTNRCTLHRREIDGPVPVLTRFRRAGKKGAA
jgi:hypothetical protein